MTDLPPTTPPPAGTLKRPEPFGKTMQMDKVAIDHMRAIENYADALEDQLAAAIEGRDNFKACHAEAEKELLAAQVELSTLRKRGRP